jgi:hypothetical protein
MSIHMKSSSVVPDFVSSETGRRLQESKAASTAESGMARQAVRHTGNGWINTL